MTEYLLYLYAESPLHAGAGGSLDGLDLPVQREASTGYPVVWGQSLKGALRQAARETAGREADGWTTGLVREIFGKEVDDSGETEKTETGALNVGDAQLVAMPVPTLRSTFAWMTTSIALARLARKYKTLGIQVPDPPLVAQDRGKAAVRAWTQPDRGEVLGPCVVPIDAEPDQDLRRWAEERLSVDGVSSGAEFQPFRAKLATDLLLVGADIAPMLLRECTEQATRIHLDDAKTVQNLFSSEYLPAETILAASLTLRSGDTGANRAALKALLEEQVVQVGGDETVGKGLTRCRLVTGGTR